MRWEPAPPPMAVIKCNQPPFPCCSAGGILMVRSEKYWVQMKGSSVLTWLSQGPVALLWFSLHHLHHPLRKSELAFVLRLSLCLFLVRSPICLESFSDSFFTVFGHRATSPASCLTTTRTIWSEWTRALYYSLALAWESVALDFCLRQCRPGSLLAILKTTWSEWTCAWWSLGLALRLLASNQKEQPPLPDHLENLLIWVDSIKMIPLGFAQYVPLAPSRSPTNFGYSYLSFTWLKW